MITLIVAIAQNYAIGKDNDLLWHLSDDLKRFKMLTTDHTIIMGRHTFESLPFRPLKNRRNIVVSTSMPLHPDYEVVRSVDEALALCQGDNECFVIGGEQIFRATMAKADRLLVTWVYRDFDADTFFPTIRSEEWEERGRSERFHDEPSGLDYDYVTYVKKSSK